MWRTHKALATGMMVAFLSACGDGEEEAYTPKRYGEMRVDLKLEDKNYARVAPYCGMVFELPDYAVIEEKPAPDDTTCYIDIKIPKHKATINLTYKRLYGDLPRRLDQSHEFVYKHLIKADDYQDTLLLDPDNRVFSQVYSLTGNVAAPVQFVVTDSNYHFLRGSLDFFVKPNYDSILPVLKYVRDDIYHMINTIEWKPVEE